MGGLGEWRRRGRGTVAAQRPHPHMGIDGTDGGHLSSVYDELRATGNGGATLRSSRAQLRPIGLMLSIPVLNSIKVPLLIGNVILDRYARTQLINFWSSSSPIFCAKDAFAIN